MSHRIAAQQPWRSRQGAHSARVYPGRVSTGRGVLRHAAAGLAAGAGWWAWRHLHSPTVATWAPGRGENRRAGPLRVRVLGSGEPVVVLLHGMLAAGDSFGAAYDALAEGATLVVPDLLGFGGSMDTPGPTDAPAHVAALETALTALGLANRPTVVAGHSMGGSLALHWAAQHLERVRSVVTFGAPLYRNRVEADEHVAAMGWMEALLSGDGAIPRATCAWMCRHRTAASWLAVASRPDLPVPVARSGVNHTWASYSGALDGLIRDTGWSTALDVLSHGGIPVTLVEGDADPVPVHGRAAKLAHTRPVTRYLVRPGADHGIPLSDPGWCRRVIADAVTSSSTSLPTSRSG